MRILPFRRKPTTRDRLVAGAAGGLVGALAYVIVQQIDLKAFDHNTDDVVLLGRIVTDNDDLIRPVGMAMHLFNGASLGALYGLVVHDRLPGPPLAQGLTFAMLETVALYPLSALEDFHPGVREGRLERYTTPIAFLQQVIRHIGYGAALGPVTKRLL